MSKTSLCMVEMMSSYNRCAYPLMVRKALFHEKLNLFLLSELQIME